jgi:hypothetical protein
MNESTHTKSGRESRKHATHIKWRRVPMTDVVKKHSVSCELAQKMVDAAVARAKEIGVSENVAILDALLPLWVTRGPSPPVVVHLSNASFSDRHPIGNFVRPVPAGDPPSLRAGAGADVRARSLFGRTR